MGTHFVVFTVIFLDYYKKYIIEDENAIKNTTRK